MAININNYNDVFGKLTKAVDIASASDNEEIKKIFSKIKEKVCDIKEGGDRLKRDNEILKIGVVGQVKAGKSSFLNSLLFEGENVLPRASTPMTAGLTVLEYGEKNVFSVEYYTAKEWEKFEDKAKEYDDFVNNVKSMNHCQDICELLINADKGLLMESQSLTKLAANDRFENWISNF